MAGEEKVISGVIYVRKLFRVVIVGVILIGIPNMTIKADNGVDIANNQDGTVTVTYDNNAKAKIAVTVQKQGVSNGMQYKYFSEAENVEVEVPLTLGNGAYQVNVLKNIVDTRYSSLTSKVVTLSLKDAKGAYLTSNQMINWSKKNSAIKYANKITKKSKSQYAKIKKIYKYIVTNYHYDYNKFSKNASGSLSYYTPNINTIYKQKKGICYDISALNASMLRSVGIQTKLVTGYPKNKYFDGVSYHAWNKVYATAKKKWIIMDATCDMCLYEQGVKYKKLKMEKKAKEYSNIKYEY